jgi:hypothetical protein
MSQRNDALLLAGTAALFVGSLVVGLVWFRPIATDAAHRGPASAPGGNAYPGLVREDQLALRANWTRPEEGEDGWVYDLFDAVPTVYDSQLKAYFPRDYTTPALPDFGISLVKLGHPRYPIVLKTTLASPKGEAERIFFLENVDTKASFEVRLNRTIPDLGITPVGYKEVVTPDAQGVPVRRKVLTIKDSKLGKTLEIDDVAPLEFKEQLDIVLKAKVGEASWTFSGPGAIFEHNGATFTLKGFDLAAGTVTVDKRFTLNPRKPAITLTETLSLVPSGPVGPAPTPPSPSPSAAPSPPAAPDAFPLLPTPSRPQ